MLDNGQCKLFDLQSCLDNLKALIEKLAIKHGNFRLSSGAESTYYLDCRKVSLTYDGMMAIGHAICHNCVITAPNVVCGPESAGIPIVAAAVAAAPTHGLRLAGCFVRKEIKEHGTKSAVEGYELSAADRVVLVEDVATTGSSLVKTYERVKESGAVVSTVIALVDRLQGAGEKIKQLGVPYKALFTIADFGLR